MAYDRDNIFAKILRGEIPCDKVHEDENVLAFKDINPRKRIHVLVIPKAPYVSFDDFSANASDGEIAAFTRASISVFDAANDAVSVRKNTLNTANMLQVTFVIMTLSSFIRRPAAKKLRRGTSDTNDDIFYPVSHRQFHVRRRLPRA